MAQAVINRTDIKTCLRRTFLCAAVLLLPSAAGAAIVEATAPIKFSAYLSADEQSAPTESPGKGRADFILERDTLKLSWVVTYSGMTSQVTGVRIHGPQLPGTNGGVLIDMGAKSVASPLQGSSTLNDGLLSYLLAGRLYVNITTSKYKDGELRGQIKRQREKSAP